MQNTDQHILVREEQLGQLFSAIPLSSIISLINGYILYYLLKSVTPNDYAQYWLVLLIIVTAVRYGFFLFYKRLKPTSRNNQLWHNIFTAGTLAAGCTWGMVSVFLFPVNHTLHQAFITILMAGMTAGAVTTLSAYWLNSVAFILPSLAPLFYQFYHLDNALSQAMSFLVILYSLILLSSIHRIYQNITQNIALRYQASKREQELSQFKSSLDKTLDCVFMFDAKNLLFYYFNQGAIDQIGYSREEVLQMHPYDIKPDFDEAKFRDFIQPMLDGTQASITFETIHQHKNGQLIPVEIFLQYLNPTNEMARFVAIVRDITERKRLDRLKDEFVSTVSHELRTPLTSLSGSLGLILGGAVGEVDAKQLNLLKIAKNNSQRLLLLINDILDIEKIESGDLAYHFCNTDLSRLITKSISENQTYAEKYQLQFKFFPPDFSCMARVDPDRILQVLGNLLSNAAKFSYPKTNIEISIVQHANTLRVQIRDHGPGIAPEFQAKVFDKFSQSDATDKRIHGGTGLGLAISRSIIEQHGGQIGFETEQGIGTCFYFDLPAITK